MVFILLFFVPRIHHAGSHMPALYVSGTRIISTTSVVYGATCRDPLEKNATQSDPVNTLGELELIFMTPFKTRSRHMVQKIWRKIDQT